MPVVTKPKHFDVQANRNPFCILICYEELTPELKKWRFCLRVSKYQGGYLGLEAYLYLFCKTKIALNQNHAKIKSAMYISDEKFSFFG